MGERLGDHAALGAERNAIKERVGKALSFAASIAMEMRDGFGTVWGDDELISLPAIRAEAGSVSSGRHAFPRQYAYKIAMYREGGFAASVSGLALEQPDKIFVYHKAIALGLSNFDSPYRPEEMPVVGGGEISLYIRPSNTESAVYEGVYLPVQSLDECLDMAAFFAYQEAWLKEDNVRYFHNLTSDVERDLESAHDCLNNVALNPRP